MHSTRGFSLVELSIVLVILGLLTGGILAGQSLIHAAELRSITTEYNRYRSASQSFRDKYFAMPGDMTNATKFWGDNNSVCPTADTNGTPGTCNGNGDGDVQGGVAMGPGATAEGFQFWVQLAYAGLVEGSYTGLSATVPPMTTSKRGESVPASKYGQTGWTIMNGTDFTSYYLANDGFVPADGVKAIDAWNVDTKMDDGLPNTGNVTAGIGACFTVPTTYTLNNDAASCSLGIKPL